MKDEHGLILLFPHKSILLIQQWQLHLIHLFYILVIWMETFILLFFQMTLRVTWKVHHCVLFAGVFTIGGIGVDPNQSGHLYTTISSFGDPCLWEYVGGKYQKLYKFLMYLQIACLYYLPILRDCTWK